jgi:hypothetical protein
MLKIHNAGVEALGIGKESILFILILIKQKKVMPKI